jgi:dynein heavy chain
LSLTLSGCVAGNSGTGKTETIKDLAKAVAKQCVVFNCSDQLDYKSLGKMFKGLVSTGSWSCFDEFNRIETGVLSVVSQQILNIQQAIAESLEIFLFEGTSLHLDKTCAIFITLNTAKEGKYVLPDSLKSLLRPVALLDADPQYISEIMLYTQGYVAFVELSRKICSLFKALSDELSLQSHYDFSLREIKVVLGKTAAARLRGSDQPEDAVVYTV